MADLALGVPGGTFVIPGSLTTHTAFLKWLRATDVPEDLRIGFLNGRVRVEVMPERAFAHNRIKTTVAAVVGGIVTEEDLGIYFGDGMLFTSVEAEFTTIPDGIFVSNESIRLKRVELTGAKEGEADTRLVGSPDLILEVVSDGSEAKDTEWLMSGYWDAGVKEYWLIDARHAPLQFVIQRRGRKEFTTVRKSAGWTESPTLKRAFRFVAGKVKFGHPTYKLEVR